ncbi:MAG: glutaredoxin 3 [Gammaproteobacteria bacterium]|jgi:glutaredoxin 3
MSRSDSAPQPGIVIYSSPFCGYCAAAKSLLHAKGVSFEEIDIFAEPQRRAEMIERSGRRTVPQIFIGDQHVGGFDDLNSLERAGRLDPLLEGLTSSA